MTIHNVINAVTETVWKIHLLSPDIASSDDPVRA